ncbi:MAG: alanine racemase [Candidatus Cloacimonetes bacterium]|nr:alanine racemase [Candidatus Cloacimonadota bacterium]
MNLNITKPTLILDKQKCLDNIKFMTEQAKDHNLVFRPHFKTHQSAEIGCWFREFGTNSITVSSVEMAEYFAENGWQDITIAFPFNLLEIARIDKLAAKIKLNLLVVSENSFDFLIKRIKHKIGFFIEIDTGYHRTGISANDLLQIEKILEKTKQAKLVDFKGFLTHAGNTYQAKSKKEIAHIHFDSINKLKKLKAYFRKDFSELMVSIGDTPSCSLMDDFPDVDEIRPGNFVFYDLMQNKPGICSSEQIAVAVACPIVAKYPERNEMVIYGGAIHLSKEYLPINDGSKLFGKIVEFSDEKWSDPVAGAYLSSLSQEHGTIKINPAEMEKFKIGDIVGILPVHSCLTANLYKSYLTLSGNKILKR